MIYQPLNTINVHVNVNLYSASSQKNITLLIRSINILLLFYIILLYYFIASECVNPALAAI